MMFSFTADRLIMGGIVLVAALWAGRALWRTVKNRSVCSDCATAGDCPLVNNPEALVQLTQAGQLGKLDQCQSGAPDCKALLDSLDLKDRSS